MNHILVVHNTGDGLETSIILKSIAQLDTVRPHRQVGWFDFFLLNGYETKKKNQREVYHEHLTDLRWM